LERCAIIKLNNMYTLFIFTLGFLYGCFISLFIRRAKPQKSIHDFKKISKNSATITNSNNAKIIQN